MPSKCSFGIAIIVLSIVGRLPVIKAQQPGLDQIRVLTLVGAPLPVIAGTLRGTFAKYLIEVQTENLPSSAVMRSSLASGRGDVAYAAVDNAVAMVELSGADVQIISGGEGSQNDLIVQPAIHSIKDLEGHVILVDAVNTAYALQLKKILLLQGLQTPKDYTLNAFGATPTRLTALIGHKEFAGSMLGPPSSIEALRAGLVSLGDVPDLLGPYQAGGHFIMRKWGEEHRSTLIRYLTAFIESQRWIMDPANKQQVIDLMVKKEHLKPDVAAQTYVVEMTRPGGFEKDARIDPIGLKNVLKLRAEIEGQWGGHPPSTTKYVDDSYYDEALKKSDRAENTR